MKEFYPNDKIGAVFIHDQSYGQGCIVGGKLDEEKAFRVTDCGLCEATWNVIGRIFETDEIDLGNAPQVEGARFAFVPDTEISLEEVYQALKKAGFNQDPLAENHAKLTKAPIVEAVIAPTEQTKWLIENIDRHFKSKIESLSEMIGIPNRVNRIQILESTEKEVPFFIVCGLIEGRTAVDIQKLIRENFEKVFPNCTLRKAFYDTDTYEYAFTPEKDYMCELQLSECPTFPQDKIDSRQKVLIDLPREITEGEFIRLRRTLFKAGAVTECLKANVNQLILHIPNSYEYGGTMGNAFETRMTFAMNKLVEMFGKEPETKLLERIKLPSVIALKEETAPASTLRFTPGVPKTKLAFIRKIDEIKTIKNPKLAQKLTEAEGTITIPCCQGNFILVRKKAPDSAEVYHGVETGEQPDTEVALSTYKDLVTFSEIQ